MQKLKTLVSAIFDAAAIMRGDGGQLTVNEDLKRLRNLLFPEVVEDLEDKAKMTKHILEKEYESGPFKVQSMDVHHGKKRGKKKRR